jgi:uncharacterized protein YbjT (DUF2867 family)
MDATSPILVTGATGQIGREVIAQLSAAGQPVRALTRNPQTATFTEDVDVVQGDLCVPDALDEATKNVRAVFLVWSGPVSAASASIDRLASRAERIVFLSAPIRTDHPFFQQPNHQRHIHAAIEDLIEKNRHVLDDAAAGALCA